MASHLGKVGRQLEKACMVMFCATPLLISSLILAVVPRPTLATIEDHGGQSSQEYYLDKYLIETDIVGTDDRFAISRESKSYVAAVGVSHWQTEEFRVKGNGWSAHPRIIVTAAHLFVSEGNWIVNQSRKPPSRREFNKYKAEAAGCPGEAIAVKDVILGTMEPQADRADDWAILILESSNCLSSDETAFPMELRKDVEKTYLFHDEGEPRPRNNIQVPAFIPPYTVGLSESTSLNDVESIQNISWPIYDVILHTGFGSLKGRTNYVIKNNGKASLRTDLYPDRPMRELYAHDVDLQPGTSGAPLVWEETIQFDGRPKHVHFVIGMQVAEAIGAFQENYAIPYGGKFRQNLERVYRAIQQ